MFEVTETFVALFNGETKVVQLGTITSVSKYSKLHPTAFPAELYGVIVTYIIVSSGKSVGGL